MAAWTPERGSRDAAAAIARARALFLDEAHPFGCAETPSSSSGGVRATGRGGRFGGDGPQRRRRLRRGICGALTGSALAVGLLSGARSTDHATAKRQARQATARLIDDFEATFGAIDCRELSAGRSGRPRHAAFIESGSGARSACARSSS
jgi:hypothetical protein